MAKKLRGGVNLPPPPYKLGLNTEMSTPALTSSVLIHLAKVSSEGFLYGLPKVISKDPVSAGTCVFRCLVYSSKQLTTHSFVFH